MNSYKLTGTILEIFDTQVIGDKGFKKREFILEYIDNPEYPEYIKFEVIKDNCEDLDKFHNGSKVEVSFNLKGRSWTNPKGEKVYFNSIHAWRVVEDKGTHDLTPEIEANQAEEKLPWE